MVVLHEEKSINSSTFNKLMNIEGKRFGECFELTEELALRYD